MRSFNLYYLDNSERSIWEAESKGYRNDVYVEIKEDYFHIHVYDNVRLIQDFEEEIKQYGFYQIEPNLILVQTVNNMEIINIIDKLMNAGYFHSIKPKRKEEIETLKLIRITK